MKARKQPKCSVYNCDRPACKEGLCAPHWQRLYRYGAVFASVPVLRGQKRTQGKERTVAREYECSRAPPAKRRGPMKTMDDVLGAIRLFFEDQSVHWHEKVKLWDVLSAIRGPDDGNLEDKKASTCIIRARAFGLQARTCALANRDHTRFVLRREAMSAQNRHKEDHFYGHMRRAFRALGLAWNVDNDA